MEGILPRKVDKINILSFTLLIEAAKVTNPDGIKGIIRPSNINIPAFRPLLIRILSISAYLPLIFSLTDFNPSLYILKVIHPPTVSPRSDMVKPRSGPKKMMFAPVTNTEGIIPDKAINMLMIREINKAKSLY